jgi:hypothetical protein
MGNTPPMAERPTDIKTITCARAFGRGDRQEQDSQGSLSDGSLDAQIAAALVRFEDDGYELVDIRYEAIRGSGDDWAYTSALVIGRKRRRLANLIGSWLRSRFTSPRGESNAAVQAANVTA